MVSDVFRKKKWLQLYFPHTTQSSAKYLLKERMPTEAKIKVLR